jgi:hypothetical protein
MTINVKPEHERVIGLAIQAGLIHAADDIVDFGVEAIRQRLESQIAANASLGREQWSQEFHAWIHGHSTATPLLSDEAISRESIYDSRGL